MITLVISIVHLPEFFFTLLPYPHFDFFFFLNDPAPPEIYPLPLPAALPISWLRARPERAARYGVKAITRALAGIPGPTVVHLCFGYAAAVHDKPSGYSFLPQLADTSAAQISIEAAQPRLDLGVLKELSPKTVVLGVIDLGTEKVESAEEVARRIRAALEHVPPERLVAAPDCGMKNLTRAAAV